MEGEHNERHVLICGGHIGIKEKSGARELPGLHRMTQAKSTSKSGEGA